MITIKGLEKAYRTERGQVEAVRGVNFEVNEGEFFTLLGPSGCGKSTILRCIAGLEKPEQGEIIIANTVVFSMDRGIFVPPHEREISMVFQSYAIWPHMTVYQNVVYPLEGKMSKSAMREKVMEALSMVGIEKLEDRPAPLLSGGQQQRVALARALVKGAKVLLLDEPLSNLDAKLRIHMRFELRELHNRIGITTLYVTHDQEEAISLSDRLAVICDGEIVEIGTPINVYMQPKCCFAADFVGSSNMIPGILIKRSEKYGIASTSIGEIECSLPGPLPDDIIVSIRPEHIEIVASEQDYRQLKNVFKGTVRTAVFLGKNFDCTVQVGSESIRLEVPSSRSIREGSTVYLHFPPDVCCAIPADTLVTPVGE
jgi:iron(III) transport system ATP-binding protein